MHKADAISNYQNAIAIFRRVLGENHPNTQKVINNYLRMLLEAPKGEVFPLISPEWQKIILRMNKSHKINNTNSSIRQSKLKRKNRKKGKGFGN